MAAHRRVAERHVEIGPCRLVDPKPPAPSGHHDRVATMRAEDFERFGNAHHGGLHSLLCGSRDPTAATR
jgi:hypothetical protein